MIPLMTYLRPPKKTKIVALDNASKVMVEILNVPDDIPEDLLNKAECVIPCLAS
jgi:hypothetical protein